MIDSKEKKDVRQTQEFLVRQWRAEQYALKMNLPVPVLAEPKNPDGTIGEARESTTKHALRAETSEGLRQPATGGDSRGGQTFDKKAYQREYMRKKRADADPPSKDSSRQR